MTDKKTDQLELKLKTLAGILKRLSLPELFEAQDLLSGVIKDKVASEQRDKIRLMKLYNESQKLLQESRDESIRLEKDCLYLSGRFQHLCYSNMNQKRQNVSK